MRERLQKFPLSNPRLQNHHLRSGYVVCRTTKIEVYGIIFIYISYSVCGSSNNYERSFNQARLIMINHLRKFMNTRSLRMLMFFKYKKKLKENLTIINDNITKLAQKGIEYDELDDADEDVVYSY